MSGKKFGIYYNQEFNVYMVALTPSVKVVEREQHDNVTLLKDKQEIVGFNIFPAQAKHRAPVTFCSELPSVVEYVQRKVKPFMNLQQAPQFLVAKIEKLVPIPGTHLHHCELNIGQEKPIPVVTGAHNVKVGQYSVLATSGAWMPNSQVITPKKMQGYPTEGMLCSTRELHLGHTEFNQSGIIDLPTTYHAHLGQSFWKVYYGAHQA